MKDLDFDELDKAVNSLMSTKDEKPGDTAPAEPVTTDTDTTTPAVEEQPTSTPIPAPTAPEPATPEPEATDVAVTKPARPTATPPARRRGQFMDVVHPSSDMRTPATGRTGVTIAPPSPTPSQAPTPEPVPAPETPETPVAEETPAPTMSTMPDPIDMQEAMAEKSTTVEPAVPAESDNVSPFSSTLTSDSSVAESPFLPDAQVEKRPLGSAALSGDTAAVQELNDTTKSDESTPAEESVPVETSDAPIDTPTSPEKPADSIVTTVEPIKESAAGSSIAPQYKEKESTGDKAHAALYDADNMNVPLIHPAKERSGWLWVLWTFLLVVLGALGAATLWYFKII